MKRCDWSIGSVYKHQYEASTMLFISGFRKFISSVNNAHFRKKNFQIFISKWNFEINLQCKRGLTETIFAHYYNTVQRYLPTFIAVMHIPHYVMQY